MLNEGFVDTFRHFYPDLEKKYSWWSHQANARSRNVGWRLDYFVTSKRLVDQICDNQIRDQVFGSDHCPSTLFLALWNTLDWWFKFKKIFHLHIGRLKHLPLIINTVWTINEVYGQVKWWIVSTVWKKTLLQNRIPKIHKQLPNATSALMYWNHNSRAF